MKKILIITIIAFAVSMFAACGHRAETVDNVIDGEPLDTQTIERSITLAARSLGWQVQPIDSQTMEASIKSYEHSLTVVITFTPESYVIQYKDSLNLDFDNEDNSIDSQYADWVEDLDERIQEEMQRLNDK